MAFVQADKASGASASTLTTAGITTTAGNFLAVVISLGSGPKTLSSITDSKGNTWIAASGNPQSPNSQYNVYVYYAKNIAGGASHTVTMNSSGAGICAMSVIELSGRDITSPIAFQTAATETTGVSSHTSPATGTLPSSGCDVLCLVGDNAFDQAFATETYTATSTGWLLPSAGNVNTGSVTATSFIMYRPGVDTTTQQATWTNSSSNLKSAAFVLAIAAAPGGAVRAQNSLSGGMQSLSGGMNS